ncbi:MAG TPA: aminoglycoside phosphotransferase family protein [Pilimelia sp.]|nr:aminoglycoside phosphotransferase family protein [Pilimelia sp.]
MRRLPHGYTNDTRGDGAVVVKRYDGPDAADRQAREQLMLDRLSGSLPVPALLSGGAGELTTRWVAGVHGQELIEAGHAAAVLRACGTTLRRVHATELADVFGDDPRPGGTVLVHGDYGPNNILLAPPAFTVTAVLDWEWAHPGRPIEDIAWCEWIVRTHHPRHAAALDEFFAGYGHRPAWAERREAMLDRCSSLLEFCRRWTPAGVQLWRRRLDDTAGWTE